MTDVRLGFGIPEAAIPSPFAYNSAIPAANPNARCPAITGPSRRSFASFDGGPDPRVKVGGIAVVQRLRLAFS
jgi:hypothetical protein